MKKALFSFVALAALYGGSAYAVEWDGVENLALNGAVDVSSTPDREGGKAAITDGNLDTSWQAKEIGADLQRDFADWFIVDLGEVKTFTDIEISWQSSHPYYYDIYVTDEKPTIEAVEGSETSDQIIAADWLAANTPVVVNEGCGNYNDQANEVITTSGTFSGRYIMVYAKNYAFWAVQYGIRPYELRVADLSAVANKISTLKLDSMVMTNGATADATVTAWTTSGAQANIADVENLTLTCSDSEAAVITSLGDGKFSIEAKKMGMYKMTAAGTSEGAELSVTTDLIISYDWANVTNLALGKKAYSNYNNAIANLSVDGDYGTRWETGDNVTSGVKYYVDLSAEYNVSAIGFNWDRAYANKYILYVAPDGVEISGEDGVNNEAWTEFLTVDRTLASAEKNTDTNVLDTPVKARYIMIESVETQIWGMSFYEMLVEGELAAEIDPTKVTSIEVSGATIKLGESANVAVKAFNKLGAEVTDAELDVTLTADSESVTIEKNEDGTFNVTASESGAYTLTATALVGEDTFTATSTLTVLLNWETTENIADPTVNAYAKSYASHNNDNAYMSNDGNTGTRWEAGGGATGDTAWWYVDLGNSYNVTALEMVWEGAYAKSYEVLYATTADTETGEPIWNETPIFTQDKELAGFPNTDTHLFDAVEARYIKIHQLTEGFGGYGMSMWEVRVAGTPASEPVVSTLNLTVAQNALLAGESTTLTLDAVDNYGKAFPTDEAVITLEDNTSNASLEGLSLTTTQKGAVTVKAVLGELEATVEVKTVAEGENVALASLGSLVTACEESKNPQNAIDGDAGSVWEAPYDATIGQDDNHWIMVDLAGNYNVDMVEISWEGAIAAAYTVSFSTDGENFGETPAYTHVGKDGVSAETHRFHGVEANNVRYVKVNVTRHASEWGSKIYELRVYGEGEKEMIAEEGYYFSGAWNEKTFNENVNANAAEIFLNDVRALPSEIILPEGANKNMLIYVAEGAACANQSNVVTVSETEEGTVCSANQIDLHEGVNFFVSNTIQAANVAFHCNLTAGNYAAFQLPFAYTPAADFAVYDVAGVFSSEADGKNVILSEPLAATTANIPFIVEAKADATELTATNVTIMSVIAPFVNEAPENMTTANLWGTYENTDIESYVLAVEGKEVVGKTGELRAFNAYLETEDDTNKDEVYVIRSNDWTSVSSVLFDANAVVDVYTLDGVRIRQGVKASEAALDLDGGIYIIGGKKIMVK